MPYDAAPWPEHFQTGTVHGKYLSWGGGAKTSDNGDPGTLTFTARPLVALAFSDDTIIVPDPITAQLDPTDGTFSQVLPATDDADVLPYKFTYQVTENWSGGRTFDISVPAGSDQDISRLGPLEPYTGVVRYMGPPGPGGMVAIDDSGVITFYSGAVVDSFGVITIVGGSGSGPVTYDQAGIDALIARVRTAALVNSIIFGR